MRIRYSRGYWTIDGHIKDGAKLHVGRFSLLEALQRYWKMRQL